MIVGGGLWSALAKPSLVAVVAVRSTLMKGDPDFASLLGDFMRGSRYCCSVPGSEGHCCRRSLDGEGVFRSALANPSVVTAFAVRSWLCKVVVRFLVKILLY